MVKGNGNIANLPARIRDELNYRISDGDPGNELVEWLNSNPEVVRILSERFDGTPISEQNLSEWRKRGYQKWLAHRNMFDESNALGDNAEVIAETGIDCDKLLLTLTAAYAEAIQNWIVTPGEQMLYKLAVYKNLTNGVIALQRAELQKVRLEIDRERLELLREKRRNKSASSASSSVSASANSASPEGSASSSTAGPEAPEPHRSALPAPPPCDEQDLPQEFPEAPLSALEGMHCAAAHTEARNANGIAAGAATAPSLPRGEDPGLTQVEESHAIAQSLPKPAAASPIAVPTLTTPTPEPKPCAAPAPAITPSAAPAPQPAGSTSTTTQTTPPQPQPAAPPKPVAPQNVPMWPTHRPGGPPRNASPRNPLGLL
jgi:hypothetical protein